MADTLAPQDLQFKLSLVPDTAAVNAALLKVANQVNKTAAAGGAAMGKMLAGTTQGMNMAALATASSTPKGMNAAAMGALAKASGGGMYGLPNPYIPPAWMSAPYGKKPPGFNLLGPQGGTLSPTLAGIGGGTVPSWLGQKWASFKGGAIPSWLGQKWASFQGGSAGGMSGMAKGGADIVMMALKKASELATGGIKGLNVALQEFQGNLGPIGTVFSSLQGIAKTIGGPVGEEIVGAFRGIADSLVSMSRLASPGDFRLWTMALEDVQAVIGHSFTPMLNLMRDGVRTFGDVLATILPTQGEANEMLTDFREAWRELKGALLEAQPWLKSMLHTGLKQLAGVMTFLARAADLAVRSVTRLALALGIYREDVRIEQRSSFGATARPATMTSLEEYQRQLQLAAFSLPGSDDVNYDPIMSATLDNILDRVNSILVWLQNTPQRVQQSLQTPMLAGGHLLSQTLDPFGIRRAIQGWS